MDFLLAERRIIMKLDAVKFGLAGGIFLALSMVLFTIAAMAGMPGLSKIAAWLANNYGTFGYSISVAGVITGTIWGFVKGFVLLWFFAWTYNKLLK
jgi:hypothetical protein